MPPVESDRRRQLPAVDRVLADPRLESLQTLYGTGALATQARAELAELRQELAAKASGEIAPVGAAEFARFQSADVERWRSVTQAAKIQPE